MDYEKFMAIYKKEHSRCPKCHSKNLTMTIVGFFYDENHPEEYKDKNAVRCDNCGWRGVRHNCVPE